MTTPNKLISQALMLIGCRAPGEPVGGDELTDCYHVFTRMIDALRLDGLLQQAELPIALTCSAGDNIVLIGAYDGIVSATVTVGDESTRLERYGREEYALIPDKTTQGVPIAFYQYFDGLSIELKLWPVPSSSLPLAVNVRHGLTFDDVNDDRDLPAGYESMLVDCLAVDLAPLYEREAPASVIAGMRNKKAAIRRMNWQGISPDPDMVRVS